KKRRARWRAGASDVDRRRGEEMWMHPAYATPEGQGRGGSTLADLTLIDMHEAFAAQTLANLKMFASAEFARDKLGRSQAIGEVDMDKFNVLG
ncbi:hypothetical protein ACQ4LF_23970, partial [Aeromonas salmonicida]